MTDDSVIQKIFFKPARKPMPIVSILPSPKRVCEIIDCIDFISAMPHALEKSM
jgi:hypothetical protein